MSDFVISYIIFLILTEKAFILCGCVFCIGALLI